MTDLTPEYPALVARLRDHGCWNCGYTSFMTDEAADRIEALTAENERLREALKRIAEQTEDHAEWIVDTSISACAALTGGGR